MLPDSLDELEIRHGTKIGRFVVIGELGAGAMGVVYAAHDRELDRQVALKVLRGGAATEQDRLRVLREGQAMARVTHPHVITVYEVGTEGSVVFLAQELLDGGALSGWLAGRHTQDEILDKFVLAGRGLAAAHAASLVHRDFKPDNVLLGKDGRVCVSDFGLARALGASVEPSPSPSHTGEPAQTINPMSPLTRTGAVMGTPMYMAPEQHLGERADERSDQFSFCVALYQALYGELPFAGKTSVALADSVIHGRLQPTPRGRNVPARLRKVLLRGLSVEPADRYPSMDALLADLTRKPRRVLPRIMLAAAVVMLIGGAVVGGYLLRPASSSATAQRTRTQAPLAVDVKNLTNDRDIAWLSTAMERGQLDDALEKYDMAAALKLQAGEPAQASIAGAAGAFAMVLRGRLGVAQRHLRDAAKHKGNDPVAAAYIDMATAALSLARGNLRDALERSQRCARAFAEPVPTLSARCLQLQGEAATELGMTDAARAAFTDGLAVAKANNSLERTATLELAIAQLDLDAGDYERVAAQTAAVQASTGERGAVIPEATAWVLLARARLEQAESQKALEALDQVKPATLQSFWIHIMHKVVLNQTVAMLGDPDGLNKIEEARNEADRAGFIGLALEARLARVTVQLTNSAEGAQDELAALVSDAKARGFARIANRAETINER
ncbi:MAG: protein kinase [Kofleriaceae bacterium]